jgi:hypothetical protein
LGIALALDENDLASLFGFVELPEAIEAGLMSFFQRILSPVSAIRNLTM